MFDPRLYIIGALALLSVVSFAYLIFAAIRHAVYVARSRPTASSAPESLHERIEVVPEPVVPAGPPPVLDSDPFGQADHVTVSAAEQGPGSVSVSPARPLQTQLEPLTAQPSAAPQPPQPLSVPEPEVAMRHPVEPLSADQTERIAALLASLEEQAEAEIAVPPSAPVAEPEIPRQVPEAVPAEGPARPAEPPAPVPAAPEAQPAPSVPPARPVPASAPAELPVSVAAHPDQPSPASAPGAPEQVPSASRSPEYRLVAPVELHFTDGSSRVGVRPGTRTHDEFQRLANGLLGELKRTRTGSGQ